MSPFRVNDRWLMSSGRGPEADSDGAASAEPADQDAPPPLKARKAITRTRAEQRARRRQQQKVAQQRYRRDSSLIAHCLARHNARWAALTYFTHSSMPAKAEVGRALSAE